MVTRADSVPVAVSVPPRDMPPDLTPAYTRCGSIRTASYFVDDSYGGQGSHYQYAFDQVEALVEEARFTVSDAGLLRMPAKQQLAFRAITRQQQRMTGARVIVFGSVRWSRSQLQREAP